jgi:cell division septum initiation protein DivIVA
VPQNLTEGASVRHIVTISGADAARLTGARIRQARFRRKWWNGVDSGEVMTLLRHVAAELEELADELTAACDENARLKAALQEWQTAVGVAPVRRPDTQQRRPSL